MGLKYGGSFTSKEGPGPGNYNSITFSEARINGSVTFGKLERINGMSRSISGHPPGPG